MKRFYAVLLMMSLLLPLGAFATNLEITTSPDTLSKKDADALTEENEALTAYLIEHVSSTEDIEPSLETFYAEHPEYVDNIKSSNPNRKRQELNTETIYSEETPIGENGKHTLEIYIIYYDDGSCIIGTFSSTNTGIPEELPDGQPIPTNTLENQLDK